MIPAELNFSIYKGSTLVKPMQWKSGDPLAVVDITGCTIRMQIRSVINPNVVIDTLTSSNGRIVVDNAAQGQFSLHFPSTSTSGITAPNAKYDLEIVYPGDEPQYTIVKGMITYIDDVTKL